MLASTFLSGQAFTSKPMVAAAPRRTALLIESAHKKGAGSTKNGRDSKSKRRGIKVYGGQPVKAGGIIVRQVGSTWYPGTNAATGSDYTLFSLIDGIVYYDKKKEKAAIHVYPIDHAKSQASIQATHTIKPKEGVPSRKARKAAALEASKGGSTLSVATVAASIKP